MSTLYLFNCPTANGIIIPNQTGLGGDSRGVPHCTGGGTWIEVQTGELNFDLAEWLQTPANQAEFAAFFGAGFTLVAVANIVGWGVRALLSMLNH